MNIRTCQLPLCVTEQHYDSMVLLTKIKKKSNTNLYSAVYSKRIRSAVHTCTITVILTLMTVAIEIHAFLPHCNVVTSDIVNNVKS